MGGLCRALAFHVSGVGGAIIAAAVIGPGKTPRLGLILKIIAFSLHYRHARPDVAGDQRADADVSPPRWSAACASMDFFSAFIGSVSAEHRERRAARHRDAGQEEEALGGAIRYYGHAGPPPWPRTDGQNSTPAVPPDCRRCGAGRSQSGRDGHGAGEAGRSGRRPPARHPARARSCSPRASTARRWKAEWSNSGGPFRETRPTLWGVQLPDGGLRHRSAEARAYPGRCSADQAIAGGGFAAAENRGPAAVITFAGVIRRFHIHRDLEVLGPCRRPAARQIAHSPPERRN